MHFKRTFLRYQIYLITGSQINMRTGAQKISLFKELTYNSYFNNREAFL